MAQGPAIRATSRSWVFTWNNYPVDAYSVFEAQRADLISCINIGREVGASGTPHLQGHAVFKRAMTLRSLQRIFPGAIHWEVRRGTEQQAVDYTRKDGDADRLDWDDRAQGSRSDLKAMAALVQADPVIAVTQVAQQMPEMFIKFHSGVAALQRALLGATPLHILRNVRWHHGPTGTGKTYTATAEACALAGDPARVFVWSTPNLKFAGSYAGQEYVVIDELRTNWEHFSFSGLLSLLGNSRHEVEVKGSTVPWRATHIWVTAPVEPRFFCSLVGDPIEQLLRRINSVRVFDVPYHEQAAAAAPPPVAPSATASLGPTQIVSDSDSDADSLRGLVPRRSPAVVVRPGARAPLPVSIDLTQTDSDDEQ